MDSLARSSATKLYGNGDFYSPHSARIHSIGFLRLNKPNNKKVHFSSSNFTSLQFFTNSIESIQSSFPSSFSQMSVANGEALTEATDQSNMVHVKFQLQKECLFGEHFLLVGDDPSIGQWDPASAIPLDWSDEHVWSVELDLPVGRLIQFKFILRVSEEFFWQPGPDRILEISETNSMVVVLEDWENAELQKITEEPNPNIYLNVVEDTFHIEAEPNACDNKEAAITENASLPREEAIVNESKESITKENNISYFKEETSANTQIEKKLSIKLKEGSLVAENIFGWPGIIANEKKLEGSQDVDLVGYVREPVLVPGMTPMRSSSSEEVIAVVSESNGDFETSSSTEEVISIELESISGLNTLSRTDDVEEPGMPKSYGNLEHRKEEVEGISAQEETTFTITYNELKEEHNDNELEVAKQLNGDYYMELKEEQQEKEPEVSKELNGDQEQSDCQVAVEDALQNDFQWGRKTLSKILTTLGFLL